MRKNFKKLITFGCMFALLFCLGGCSSSQDDLTNSESTPEENESSSVEDNRNDNRESSTVEDAEEESVGSAVSEEETSFETQNINVGEAIATDGYEFVLDGATWSEEIIPPNTSGVYTYLQDDAGKTNFVITGTFKNLSSNTADVKYGTVANIKINDKYEFDCVIAGSEIDGTNLLRTNVDPLETINIYIFVSVSDSMKEEFSSAELTWGLPEDFSDSTRVRRFEEASIVYSALFNK